MNPPTITLGKYFIKYRQIPYDDRYFIIKYDNIEISKIPFSLFEEEWLMVFPYNIYTMFSENEKRITNFLNKVEIYNEYLDVR